MKLLLLLALIFLSQNSSAADEEHYVKGIYKRYSATFEPQSDLSAMSVTIYRCDSVDCLHPTLADDYRLFKDYDLDCIVQKKWGLHTFQKCLEKSTEDKILLVGKDVSEVDFMLYLPVHDDHQVNWGYQIRFGFSGVEFEYHHSRINCWVPYCLIPDVSMVKFN